MKLYIPTSTLNVSNILSSGSISPISFYGERQFGIRFFEPIKETANWRDAIILFANYPTFTIVSEKESHPMVLEVELQEECVRKSNTEGIYYSTQTIFITPRIVKFFFNLPADKSSALSRIEQSDEAKFFETYKKCFVLKTNSENSFELKTSTLNSLVVPKGENIAGKISADFKRDRIAGALCGYFIGANGFEDVQGEVYIKRNWIKDLISKLLSIFMGDGDEELSNEMKSVQEKAQKHYSRSIEKLSGLCDLSPEGKLSVYYKNDTKNHILFFENIWKNVLSAHELSQKDFSKEGGNILKEITGSVDWNTSDDRKYLMQLFNNVVNYDDFDIETSDSIVLKSFAAFVQRGCLGDWDKLLDYLDEKQTSIPDRRFIYGLYGGYCGFSTMSKTLSDTTAIPLTSLEGMICDIKSVLETVKSKPRLNTILHNVEISNQEGKGVKQQPSDTNIYDDLYNNSNASKEDLKVLSRNKERIVACGEDYGCIKTTLLPQCKSTGHLMKYIDKKYDGLGCSKYVNKHEADLFTQKYIDCIRHICASRNVTAEVSKIIINNFNYAYKKDVVENHKQVVDAIRYTGNLCFSNKTLKGYKLEDTPANRSLLEEIKRRLNEVSDD